MCAISYVTTVDQSWHHLYSFSARGKDLSNDAQINVIGSMELEIKFAEKCSEISVKNVEKSFLQRHIATPW